MSSTAQGVSVTNWTGIVGYNIDFRVLHPLLGRAKRPTRSVGILVELDIGISFGHFGDYI